MIRISVRPKDDYITLGYEGENNARVVVFDRVVASWQSDLGEGVATLVVQPPNSTDLYPAAVQPNEEDQFCWVLSASDMSEVGEGSIQLLYYVKDKLVKSKLYFVTIQESLGGDSGELPPPAYANWVEQVISAGATAEQAAQTAKREAERAEAAIVHSPKIVDGNWHIWNDQLGDYEDTGIYSGGDAPYIGENGNWFIGDQDTGVKAQGPQGKPGDPGTDGDDGISPTVRITPADNGTTVTIIDATGEKSFTIKNGKQGDPGRPGKDAEVDATLSKPGQAADAAKTGEAVRQLNESLAVAGNEVTIGPPVTSPAEGVKMNVDPDAEEVLLATAEDLAGKADKEGVLELIESFVSDGTLIYRNREPDTTLYKFSAIRISAFNPTEKEFNSAFFLNGYGDGSVAGSLYCKPGKLCVIDIYQRHGRWESRTLIGGNTQVLADFSGVVYNSRKFGATTVQTPFIKSLETGGKVAAGLEIKIEAVRGSY